MQRASGNYISANPAGVTLSDTPHDKIISGTTIKASALTNEEHSAITSCKKKNHSATYKKRSANGFIDDLISPQDDSIKVLTVHPLVGEIIDSTEKARHNLFDFWDDRSFVSARFIEKSGEIYLEGTMKSGEVKTIPYTEQAFNKTNTQISAPPEKENQISDEAEVGLLIVLYIVLGLLLLFALTVICLALLLILGGTIFYLAVSLSAALVGIVFRAMVNSIEERQS